MKREPPIPPGLEPPGDPRAYENGVDGIAICAMYGIFMAEPLTKPRDRAGSTMVPCDGIALGSPATLHRPKASQP